MSIYRSQLEDIYQKHSPSKENVSRFIDKVLENFRGREPELIAKIKDQYLSAEKSRAIVVGDDLSLSHNTKHYYRVLQALYRRYQPLKLQDDEFLNNLMTQIKGREEQAISRLLAHFASGRKIEPVVVLSSKSSRSTSSKEFQNPATKHVRAIDG